MADPRPPLVEERIRLPAHTGAIDDMHAALDRFWAHHRARGDQPDAAWRHELTTAVVEIGTNIVHHGTPFGPSRAPIALRLRAYPDRVEGCFADRGVPFVERSGGDGSSAAGDRLDDLPASGYGLPIARAALDDLTYRRSSRGTNFWHLVKRRRPDRGGP